jgi:hypothetical protein
MTKNIFQTEPNFLIAWNYFRAGSGLFLTKYFELDRSGLIKNIFGPERAFKNF